MEEDDQERRGFRVTDRRRFADSGEPKADAPENPPVVAAAEPAAPEVPREDEDVPVTFSTFVLGLSTQALLHLGEIPDPQTRTLQPDLVAAKQVIDILGVLSEKTRNNLDPGEQALLESVLYDLRMRYVELIRKEPKERT